MNQNLNVLIIEDHPLIISAYKEALKRLSKETSFNFTILTISTYEKSVYYLNNKEKLHSLDLVLLDIMLPSKGQVNLAGAEIGARFKSLKSDLKILISTGINDNFQIRQILKRIDPDGFVLKKNIDPERLVTALKIVLELPPYYCGDILKLLRNDLRRSFSLDSLDRKLLFELAMGTRNNELPDIIPLSLGGIEHRKRSLKELFGVRDEDDQALIKMAKRQGVI